MPFWLGQESLGALQWISRATVTFIWLFVISKLTGQREIGRLTLFDFVVAITIGSVAAGPLSRAESGLDGSLISVAVLGAFNIGIAFLALKNAKFRRVVQEEPILLMQDGRILHKMLGQTRVNLDGLLAELRLKGFHNIHDVAYAILETNGKISVIPKAQSRPLTPADMSMTPEREGLATVLIEDGNIIEDNLSRNKLDKKWLLNQLHKEGVENPKTVFAAILDSRGRLYVSKKDG